MPGFTLKKVTRSGFEDVLARIPDLLKAEGFGILTRIDVKATLKEKIGAEFRPYRILGACNPQLAHKVLGTDLEIGAMLPCNVVVYQGDDGNAVVLAVESHADRRRGESGREAVRRRGEDAAGAGAGEDLAARKARERAPHRGVPARRVGVGPPTDSPTGRGGTPRPAAIRTGTRRPGPAAP